MTSTIRRSLNLTNIIGISIGIILGIYIANEIGIFVTEVNNCTTSISQFWQYKTGL